MGRDEGMSKKMRNTCCCKKERKKMKQTFFRGAAAIMNFVHTRVRSFLKKEKENVIIPFGWKIVELIGFSTGENKAIRP